ncbi:odorant receptor 131-2-like [Engraulis encrasicolus]|uniref:odorant receptor 131-2-like n=1 Tax=Engraulis encrasicolus TaxID=184585 RepID=UPI002FCF4A62
MVDPLDIGMVGVMTQRHNCLEIREEGILMSMQNATGSGAVFPAIFSSLEDWLILKGVFSMAPCIFFLYVNLVMLFTLRSKEMFTETPRYILFCHLLLSDSLQLWCTFVFYILYSLPLDEVNTGSIALVFTLACLLIIYVYIAIAVTARSTAATEKSSVGKAHKTVLLHMVQLCLCLSSLLFGTVRRALAMSSMDRVIVDEVTYVLFLALNILPRCLSPLIYGLRDKAFCDYFKINLVFCIKAKLKQPTHPV